MKNRFNIDFFEFAFLVEACIPPRPIARMIFWYSVIDKHYHELSNVERADLFNWMKKHDRFETTNEDCRLFYARFNPENQYIVETECEGKRETNHCFRFDDRYYTKRNSSIIEEFITQITHESTNQPIKN